MTLGNGNKDTAGGVAAGSEVDVWVVRLDSLSKRLDEMHGLLSEEERRRAGRPYRRDGRKRRYVVRQGALRSVLSRYCGVEPAAVPIGRSALGKPRLDLRRGRRRGGSAGTVGGIEFSASDSHDLAVFAIARDRAIGADVEFVRPGRQVERIGRRMLAPADVRRLAGEPPERRLEAFYRCWTAAEAYSKASGKGLPPLMGADGMDGLSAGGAAELGDGRWWLTSLDPADGYVASLVVEGPAPTVRLAEWCPPAPGGTEA